MSRIGLLLMVVCALVARSVAAVELLFTPGKDMGFVSIDKSRNRWKAERIQPDDPQFAAVACAEHDLFTVEYGKPVAPFLMSVSGTTNRIWGAAFDDPNGVAIRWGKGWSDMSYNHIRLDADAEVAGVPVECRIVQHDRVGKRTLATVGLPVGRTKVDRELALYRGGLNLSDGGVELVLVGKGATVRFSRFVIAPAAATVSLRKRFTLRETPWRGGLSLNYRPGHRVTVNGVRFPDGVLTWPGGLRKLDVTSALKAGENEVEISYNADAGSDRTRHVAAEIFAVYRDGMTQLVPTDGTWEGRLNDGEWKRVRALGREGFVTLPNGTVTAEGAVPLHAGALAPTNADSPWPVFDADKPIVWKMPLPPDLTGAEVEATVTDRETGTSRTVRGTPSGTFDFPPFPVGAYRIDWKLFSGDIVVDADQTEMIVTGKVPADEVGFADFEPELRKRLRLTDEIDCTTEADETNFLDHTSAYSEPRLNVGRVSEEGGFRFRETGDTRLDLFIYHIKVGTLGAPHILEADYPDTRRQSLYVSVNETFPMPFCNNSFPVGSLGWPNGTGAVVTGETMPLTGEKKTLRVVFFPGSRNITALFENGITGTRAAVCGLRVYEVEGGLPALKIPQTGRTYANHNERPLFGTWGGHVSPRIRHVNREYAEDYWYATYAALKNRIAFLRFAGHNASLEGAFMYFEGFKTESGESRSVHPDFDFLVPMIKMYAANGIKTFLGYEYNVTPNLLAGSTRDTSDRDVAAGAETVSFVDCKGRQCVVGFGGGLDFMHPAVIGSMTNLLGEIYRRYAPLGVEGLVLQTEGCAWQPCYMPLTYARGCSSTEMGYGDRTVGLFERECGISLGVSPNDPDRFARRYELLTNRYAETWWRWRDAKKRDCHRILRSVVSGGEHPWRYLVSPSAVGDPRTHTPFSELDATAAERADFVHGCFDRLGYTQELYAPGAGVELVPKLDYLQEHGLIGYGAIFSKGACERVRANDAVYLTSFGLNEHLYSRIVAPKKWWWTSYGVNVFDSKASGEFAFYDCVGQCARYTPRTMFHTWLDMNCTTGFTDESRRFLNGFYATPLGEPTPYANAEGVSAKVYGSKLQLVNDTPYEISEKDGLAIPPFGIVVLDKPRPVKFRYSEEVSRQIRAKAKKILKTPELAAAIDSVALKRLQLAKDDYGRETAMRDFEILAPYLRYCEAGSNFANQRRLVTALEKDGVARIDCGKYTETVDEQGAVWLPDQVYLGYPVYGSEYAYAFDRGPIMFDKTPISSVYRTEVSTMKSALRYVIPVPEGRYTVKVLYADCWNKEPGIWQTLRIGDSVRRYDTVRDIGRQVGGVHVFTNVSPVSGRIEIRLDWGIINGIEIRKEK